MSLNADPLSRISKSFSSSSADQIVEALRAPVRTIPSHCCVFCDCPKMDRHSANYGSLPFNYSRLQVGHPYTRKPD